MSRKWVSSVVVVVAIVVLVRGATRFIGTERAFAQAEAFAAAAPVSSIERMTTMRLRGWRLLEPLTHQTEGLLDPYIWTPSYRVFPPGTLENGPPVRVSGLIAHAADGSVRTYPLARETDVAEGSRADAAPLNEEEQSIWQVSFYNDVALRFIEDRRLNVLITTDVLQGQQIREIEFPAGAMAIKTFWYELDSGKTKVRKWDWKATEGGSATLDLKLLHAIPNCASEAQQDCFKASDFYTTRVEDPKNFACTRGRCKPQPKKGSTMILIALHIASKETPEWFWTTFWWRGEQATHGTSWTCDDAQREEEIGDVNAPWSNYSMDVVSSFLLPKPDLAQDDACGRPSKLAGDASDAKNQHLLAAYNPFIEAPMNPNGLKSSCVDCHARASTAAGRETIPGVEDSRGPLLRNFEGHIRLDYMWSLANVLHRTEPPH